MIGIGNYIGKIMNQQGGSQSWESYWATLVSATVEDDAPTHVVLTFPTAQPTLTDTNFTIAGFTISSASWTGAVLTLVLSTAVIYGDSLTVTFVTTGGIAAVTNNVAMEAELATFIAGLTTPISDDEEIRLNNFMLYIKAGLGISSLSDQWDAAWIISGETQESSFRNLVKDAHHLTIVGTVTHTPFIGAQGNATDGYLHTHYIPSSDGSKYTVADASVGLGTRSNEYGTAELDLYATGSNAAYRISLVSGATVNSFSVRLNSDGVVSPNRSNTFDGLTVINRIGGINEVRLFKDGIEPTYSTNFPGNAGAAVGAPDVFVPIGAFNDNGTLKNFTNKIYYFAFFGKSIPVDKQLFISNAINRYLYSASYMPFRISRDKFYDAMNALAATIGMTDSIYYDANGMNVNNLVTANDLITLGLYAAQNTFLTNIWSTASYTCDIGGAHARSITVDATYFGHAELDNYYTLIWGKTGTYADDNIYNLLSCVADGTHTFICAVLGAATDANRYTATKQLIDIALVVLAEGDTSGMDIDATAGKICLLSDGVELWSKAPTTQITPVSTTKVVTSLLSYANITDYDDIVTVDATDIVGGSGPTLYAGDTFSFLDAMYILHLPSSNSTAMVMARILGAKIYIDNT